MNLLQMSLTGAVLIAVITIIRSLAINKLPKKTFSALWAVALLRLLVPFTLPSPLSVYRLFQAPQADVLPVHFSSAAVGNLPVVQNAAPHPLPVWKIVWFIGVLCCGLFFAAAYWRCFRQFQTSTPVHHPHAESWLNTHRLKRRISIRESSLIASPLTYGILRPVILMPKATNWDNENVLQYVLEHEYTHIRRFDTAAKFFLVLALCIHWFNPLVWVMYILANRDIELSCDETVVHHFGEGKRADYAKVLVSMEETKGMAAPLYNSFSKNAIEERIVAIMKTKKRSAVSFAAALMIVAATATAFATSAETDSAPLLSEGTSSTPVKESAIQPFSDGRTLEEAGGSNPSFPDGIEWWTYEEYKAWLDDEKELLQLSVGETIEVNGEKLICTQELVDETVAMYEDMLNQIKNGMMISKTVDGNVNLVVGYDPSWTTSSQDYSLYVVSDHGEERLFGPYETEEELLEEVDAFCSKQVASGAMTQKEADEILSQCKGK